MKIVKRSLLILSILFCSLIAGGILFAYLYQDEVKSYLVSKLNEGLAAEVKVQDIDFSVLRKFPNASLQFTEVYCPSVGMKTRNDTLFFMEKVFLEFNVIDIFQKNYIIRKIQMDNGVVNIQRDNYGNDNFHFWKTADRDTSSSRSFSFALNEITLNNQKFSYVNTSSHLKTSAQINSMEASGMFSSSSYSLEATGDVFINYFKNNREYFIKEKPLQADFLLQVDSSNYTITEGEAELDGIPLQIDGSIVKLQKEGNSNNGYDLNLNISGSNIDLEHALNLIPEQHREELKHYTISGTADINSSIVGTADKHNSPVWQMNYSTRRAQIILDSTGFKLSDIELNGTYKSGNGGSITISEFSSEIGSDRIKGNFSVNNFNDPFIQLSINTKANLENLHRSHLPGLDSVKSISGIANVEASIKGKLKNLKEYSRKELQKMDLSGIIELDNVIIKLNNDDPAIHLSKGSLVLNDEDVFIKNLSGNINNSDFELEGFFKNMLPYLMLENEKLFVEAELKSNQLNLNELLKDYAASSNQNTVYTLVFPDEVNLNLKVHVGELKFRRFEGNSIKGSIAIKNRKLIAKQLEFRAMDGNVNAKGIIDASRNDQVLITCDAEVDEIDINKLFYQFENFGQEVITDQHIKGITDANIQFASVWTPQLKAYKDKIYTKADITIYKGELINFEPLLALSEHIEVSELKHVKFSTLQNEIEIKNSEIHIPKMDIESSAMDISASGVHGFDNSINYKIKVYLPELLAKKSKEKKKENNEFGVIEDDGLGMWIFLTMTGTVEDPVIKYDKKGAIKKIGEDLKQEKQTLKQILNEEFGWFKKDTTLNKAEDKKNKEKKEKFGDEYFIIEWDEDAPEEEEEEDDDDF